MQSHQLLRAFAALSLLTALTACGDDIISPTFGSSCEAGDLRAGDIVTSALHEGSCRLYNFYTVNTSAYVSYSVQLEAGRAYFFSEEAVPDLAREGRNNVDAFLALYGRTPEGTGVPLAVSDDEGYSSNSEIFFVAPKSGTYQLLAMNHDVSTLGGFRLSMHECPVIGRSTGPGTDTLDVTLEPSPCRRTGAPFPEVDYSFVSIQVAPNEQIAVRVTAGNFNPGWEIFSPGFDVYSSLTGSEHYQRSGNAEQLIGAHEEGGLITLAIGAVGFAGPNAPTAQIAVRRP